MQAESEQRHSVEPVSLQELYIHKEAVTKRQTGVEELLKKFKAAGEAQAVEELAEGAYETITTVGLGPEN